MELRRIWLLIWQRKYLALAMIAVALVAGYQVTPRTARYRASAVLFVGVAEYNSAGVFSNEILQGQADLAETFALMLRSGDVAVAAQQATGVARSPSQIVAETSTTSIPNTALIAVTVTDHDPVVASALANAMSQAFVTKMLRLDPVTQTTTGKVTGPISPVSVSQQAGLPSVPLSNGLSRTLALSGIFGLLAAIALVLLIDYLDMSVRNPVDLEHRVGLPVLGVIPLVGSLSGRGSPFVPAVAVRRQPLGAHAGDD